MIKFASRLRELNAEMELIHAESKWPTSHVVQKFLDGLGSDFDLWLTTWEPNNTPIDETNSQNVVTRTAVTLEQATDAAVEFETAQKQRETGAGLLAQRAALFAQRSPGQGFNPPKGTSNKRKKTKCRHCKGNHPDDECYYKYPEKRPAGWNEQRFKNRIKRAKAELEKLQMDNKDTKKNDSSVGVGGLAIRFGDNPSVEADFTLMAAGPINPDPTPSPSLPTVRPGRLSAMFRGRLEAAEPVPTLRLPDTDPLGGVPEDSHTGKIVASCLVSISKGKIGELAAKLRKVFVLDSGCSHHTFCDGEGFVSLTKAQCPTTIGIGGASIRPTEKGDYLLNCRVEGKARSVLLKDVVYSPEASCNLISVSQLVKRGAEFLFRSDGVGCY